MYELPRLQNGQLNTTYLHRISFACLVIRYTCIQTAEMFLKESGKGQIYKTTRQPLLIENRRKVVVFVDQTENMVHINNPLLQMNTHKTRFTLIS